MRKLSITALILAFILSGCSGEPKGENEGAAAPVNSQSTDNNKEQQKIEVEKGIRNVEITLPASFFENQDIDKAIADAKKDGVTEVVKNKDGSVTYKMPKSVHSKMMKEMETEIIQSLEELKSGKDFKSIKNVTPNKTYSEFVLTVDKAAYEKSFDGFAVLALGFQGMFFQAFNGESSDKLKVTIKVKDAGTGEVFHTAVYPDSLESNK